MMNIFDDFNKCVTSSIENGRFVECVACNKTLELALMKRLYGNEYTYFIMAFEIYQGFFPVRCFTKLDTALSAYNALIVAEI